MGSEKFSYGALLQQVMREIFEVIDVPLLVFRDMALLVYRVRLFLEFYFRHCKVLLWFLIAVTGFFVLLIHL